MKKTLLKTPLLFLSFICLSHVDFAQTNEGNKKTNINISLSEETTTSYHSHVFISSLTNKLRIDFKEKKNPIVLNLKSENGLVIFSKQVSIDENFIEFETSALKEGSYSLIFQDQNGLVQKNYQVIINF